MVTKHFHNDALDGLCTDEQLNLLDAIDTLRSQGISHYISLPQIIVCGDQSSGKSSVLEAISGVSFPIKSNLCTRFPTELVLRKHSQSGVRVSIVPHHSRNEAERESLGCFCEALDGFEGLPMLIEKAKAAMGISTHGKAFANDLLRVEISGPDRPHLTIVDLPGLIHSETKQQSAADVQLVQEVVRSYMQEPRSIILAVVSAKNDVANQIVLRLARELDHLGNRTLGVITKPDILVAGSATEAMFVSLAKNQDVEFRLGWHVLKNMDSEKGTPDLQVRNAEESEFFERGIWGDMPRSLVGVASLRVRLSKLLLSQIASELPSLIDEIKVKRETCHKQLQRLGQPRTTPEEQRSYLIQISQSFQSLVRAGVDGTYNDAFFDIRSERGESQRLRAVIQNLNEAFTEHISARGHRRHLSEAHDHQTPSGRQIVVTRQDYIRHIEGLLKRTRGRELPGTFNPMIVKDLFLEQSTPWELLTRDHVGAAWASAKAFLKLVAAHVADEVTASALNSVLIAPALDRLREVLDQRTTKLLLPHQKGHPITYNHYFTETLQDIRKGRQRDNISQIIQQFFEVNDIDERYHTGRSINLRDLVNSLLGSRETDMTRFASDEALDCMLAYYKVALKRFVDDVATEVIEIELMHSLRDILSPMAVYQMADEMVTRIAGESEESRTIRHRLNMKLSVLNQGLATCRRFVGIRCLDSAVRFSFERQLVVRNHENAGVLNKLEQSDEVISLSEFSKDGEAPSDQNRECITPEPTLEPDDIHNPCDGYSETPLPSSSKSRKKSRRGNHSDR